MADLYQTLGVDRTASAAEIKKAYRNLAKKYHPDLNPNDEGVAKKFHAITQAYELLSNPDKRAQFDRGEIDKDGNPAMSGGFPGGFGGGSSGGHPFQEGFSFGEDGQGSEDLFASLFGAGRRRQSRPQPQRGQDVSYTLKIGFSEAALGVKRQIVVGDGKGVTLSIPAGMEHGGKLRLKGRGHPGENGGASGDALITIHTAKHPTFERDGLDIKMEFPLTLPAAVLGRTVRVPTIHGEVSLKIAPGSSSGKTLRLKGKGIKGKTDTGDQYVRLEIMLPDPIDVDLKNFMESYEKQQFEADSTE